MTADGTYRPARAGETITIAAELDALPVGSVLRLKAGLVASLLGDGWVIGGYYGYQEVRGADLPAAVLFRPDAPQPATTDDTVEALSTLYYAEPGSREKDAAYEAVSAALAAAGAGAEMDREALADLQRIADGLAESRFSALGAIAAEMNDALLRLAARGDAATPTVTTREARDMWNRPYPAFVQRLAALGIEVTP